MTVILGMNCYKHDAAAALMIDGCITGAAEEERFTRRKHDPDYPVNAVSSLLRTAGLKPSEVDHVAYYMIPGNVRRETLRAFPSYISRKGAWRFFLGQLGGAFKMASIPSRMRTHLGEGFRPRFHFIDHHVAHAWSAWLGAGCRKAAVLSMDGAGEMHSSLCCTVSSQGLVEYSRTKLPDSPGLFYSAVTAYLGFKPDNDEYKVMGLSSYGKPEYLDLFRKMISSREGRFVIDGSLLDVTRGVHNSSFSREVLSVLGPPRDPEEGEPGTRHENIAASAQRALEEAGMSMVRFLRERHEGDLLLVSGGVALNCVMNGLFERESGFREVLPFPAPNDSGTSIGAAVAVHRAVSPEVEPKPLQSMYLGPSYTPAEIREDLDMAKLRYSTPEDLPARIARLLDKGLVVGIFQGGMEFGPRALGNRSILADPRREDMKDIVNSVVKHREGFRPFAPACLLEEAERFFEGCRESAYMIKTYFVKPGMGRVIPAVTHVDNTARVQTVSREQNPFYYDVIKAFGELTGVPVVLNTSFNIRGEPIVNTPVDAVRCFYGTGIDALVMPPYLLLKDPSEEGAESK